jgi:hypothetical protein
MLIHAETDLVVRGFGLHDINVALREAARGVAEYGKVAAE